MRLTTQEIARAAPQFAAELYIVLKKVMCTKQSSYEVGEEYKAARQLLDKVEAEARGHA